MVSLARKLVNQLKPRLFLVALIVIACNAGGAFSPIGDVTTTMLWVGGFVSSHGIIFKLFLPSVINLLVPLLVVTFTVKNEKISSTIT